MSLSLKLGESWISGRLGAVLPQLPRLSARIFNQEWSSQEVQKDPRLEQLREQIENNEGKAPYMIDNGMILRAAPKKKPSYAKTRAKLYAPGNKQIQHLDNLVRCPACGHVKRSHFMCMNCFAEIKAFLKIKRKEANPVEEFVQEVDPIDQKILYPGKRLTDHERRLRKKDWIPVREKALPFNEVDFESGKK